MNKLMMFKVTYIEASITFRFYMLYLKLINTFMPYFFSSISRINSFITQFSILEQGKKKKKDVLSRPFYFQNIQTSMQ